MICGSCLCLQIENLKKKSILTQRSNGGLGFHDLWFEFCIAEIKADKSSATEKRRWFYELECTGLSKKNWENVHSMYLGLNDWKNLETVHLNYFPNVVVLRLFEVRPELTLDVQGLVYLKWFSSKETQRILVKLFHLKLMDSVIYRALFFYDAGTWPTLHVLKRSDV